MNLYETAASHAPALLDRYGGPVGLAGKIVGLGQSEMKAGVPWWAWLGIGIMAGGIVTYSYRDRLERILE
jgi:hypothetical protein